MLISLARLNQIQSGQANKIFLNLIMQQNEGEEELKFHLNLSEYLSAKGQKDR